MEKINSSNDFKEIVKFISDFKFNFLKNLKQKYKDVISIDLPLILKSENNINIDEFNKNESRTIDFDNSNNMIIYEFNQHQDLFIRYYFHYYLQNYHEIMFCEYQEIDRDKKINQNESLNNIIWNFEKKIHAENRNFNFLKNELNDFYTDIVETINNHPLVKTKLDNNITIINNNKTNALTAFSSIKSSFKNYLKNNKVVAFYLSKKQFLKLYDNKNFLTHDFENTIVVYCWNPYLNNVYELFNITIRPDWSVVEKQCIINLEKTQHKLVDLLKNEKISVSLSFKINLDNLFSYVLNLDSFYLLPSKILNFTFTEKKIEK